MDVSNITKGQLLARVREKLRTVQGDPWKDDIRSSPAQCRAMENACRAKERELKALERDLTTLSGETVLDLRKSLSDREVRDSCLDPALGLSGIVLTAVGIVAGLAGLAGAGWLVAGLGCGVGALGLGTLSLDRHVSIRAREAGKRWADIVTLAEEVAARPSNPPTPCPSASEGIPVARLLAPAPLISSNA